MKPLGSKWEEKILQMKEAEKEWLIKELEKLNGQL